MGYNSCVRIHNLNGIGAGDQTYQCKNKRKVHLYSFLNCLVERILSWNTLLKNEQHLLNLTEPSHSVEVCWAQKNSRGTLWFSEPDLYRWLPSLRLAAK